MYRIRASEAARQRRVAVGRVLNNMKMALSCLAFLIFMTPTAGVAEEKAKKTIEEICKKLLSNTIIENYKINLKQ